VKALVFSVIYNSFIIPVRGTICVYVLIVDRNASSLYEVRCSINKYLSRNLICYIIQQGTYARKVPDELLRSINNLYSINFETDEVINIVKEKLIARFFTKSMQRVGYIYEKDI